MSKEETEPKTLDEAILMDVMAGSPTLFTFSDKCYPMPMKHTDAFLAKHPEQRPKVTEQPSEPEPEPEPIQERKSWITQLIEKTRS